jgi:hypothetical protein
MDDKSFVDEIIALLSNVGELAELAAPWLLALL